MVARVRTDAQRQRKNQRERERQRERRANRTSEQKAIDKQRNRDRYANMSEEAREWKLQRQRERYANVTEERERKLQYERERYANMTEEERQLKNQRDRERRTTIDGRCSGMISDAKNRTDNVTIDSQWLANRWTGKCEYTDEELSLDRPPPGFTSHPNAPSIDQIDPGDGYVNGNVAIVAWWVNKSKSQMSYEEWREKTINAGNFLEHGVETTSSTPDHNRNEVSSKCSVLISAAKTRSENVTIDKNWLLAQWTGRCKYTGEVLSIDKPPIGMQTNPMAPSLDQIDPKKGYTPENVAIVAWWANNSKGEMPFEQWKSKMIAASHILE